VCLTETVYTSFWPDKILCMLQGACCVLKIFMPTIQVSPELQRSCCARRSAECAASERQQRACF
jgi:hypothetical protein